MGYDMYLRERDTSMDAANAKANADFDAAVKARDTAIPREDGIPVEGHPRYEEHKKLQAAVTEAYYRMDATNINYFRLNIWGMGRMRESLFKLGMLATEYTEPPWPEYEDHQLTSDEIREYEEFDDDDGDLNALSPKVRKLVEAVRAKKGWSPPDEPGLPVHKFGSNDGWWVTRRDIEGALAILKVQEEENPALVKEVREEWATDSGDDTNTFDEFIDWIRRAAAGDGFEVW